MSKRIHKVRKWETTGGKIIVTEFEEHGPDISIKDAIKKGMIEVSDEEMQNKEEFNYE